MPVLESHMPKSKSSKRLTSSSIFDHDSGLRVLGFTADIIAIVTVLLAIKTDTVLRALPLILSPWFLFPIWILAAYTYLCWLHAYWMRTAQEFKWSKRFNVFIIGDLLIRFRKPLLWFPVLLLIMTLVWIVRISDLPEAVFNIVTIFLLLSSFLTLMFVVGEWERVKNYFANDSQEKRDLMESKWIELSSLIEKRLMYNQWLETKDFKDAIITYGINQEILLFAFAKYATVFPEKALFSNLYDKNNARYFYKALINLQTIDRERFYIE